ncbi:MAG: right-handed parallel beta-helix repeat-containing protein [bacterium]
MMRILGTSFAAVATPLAALAILTAPAKAQQVVSDYAQLESAVAAANSGSGDATILLVDGTYNVTSAFGLVLSHDGITIKSVSGNRNAVVLQGDGMLGGSVSHIFQVTADDVTIQDMTLRNVANHTIQVHGETPYGADRTVIKNLVLRDTGEQMIKISYRDGESVGSDGGLVEGCLFEYTAGIGPQYYIGGIDGHLASNWVVRGNTFKSIRSPGPSVAEHAVHFWSESSNTLVERNLIIDCDRGIGFGLGTTRGHIGGIIRNNMIFHRDLGGDYGDVGIELETATGAQVLNNTIYLLEGGAPGGIAVRYAASTGVTVANNLIRVASGAPGVWLRDGATVTQATNVTNAQASWFVDPVNGDLHLSGTNITGVVDAASPTGAVANDFDGGARPVGPASDVGADEVGAAAAISGLSWSVLKGRFRQ